MGHHNYRRLASCGCSLYLRTRTKFCGGRNTQEKLLPSSRRGTMIDGAAGCDRLASFDDALKTKAPGFTARAESQRDSTSYPARRQ